MYYQTELIQKHATAALEWTEGLFDYFVQENTLFSNKFMFHRLRATIREKVLFMTPKQII